MSSPNSVLVFSYLHPSITKLYCWGCCGQSIQLRIYDYIKRRLRKVSNYKLQNLAAAAHEGLWSLCSEVKLSWRCQPVTFLQLTWSIIGDIMPQYASCFNMLDGNFSFFVIMFSVFNVLKLVVSSVREKFMYPVRHVVSSFSYRGCRLDVKIIGHEL